MPLPATPPRYWALYAQATQMWDEGTEFERTKRRQLIVLPPLAGAPKQDPAAGFRYFQRSQSKLDERVRWQGPYSRDAELMQNTAAEHVSFWLEQGYSDVMMVTVPLAEEELKDLRFRGKKTEYRVIDQARKIIKKKYKKDVR